MCLNTNEMWFQTSINIYYYTKIDDVADVDFF